MQDFGTTDVSGQSIGPKVSRCITSQMNEDIVSTCYVWKVKDGEFGKETEGRNGKITIGISLAELDNNINWLCEIIKERCDNVGRQNLFSSELKEFLVIVLQMEPQKGKENDVGFARNERTGIMWLKVRVESCEGL
jgi:hypothetical protein